MQHPSSEEFPHEVGTPFLEPAPIATVELLGLPFYAGAPHRFIDEVKRGTSDGPIVVSTINMQYLALAQRTPGFGQLLEKSDVAIADGAPVAWLARALHLPVERVAGADVVRELIGTLPTTRHRVFLLGSDDRTLRAVAQSAERAGFPLCGTYSPSPEEVASAADSARICEMINAAEADFLIVLLGAPKQDRWAADYRDGLRCRVIIGAGGALDFLAGTKRRAPRFVQAVGLEWLFRLCQDPRRLWRRYLIEYWYGLSRIVAYLRHRRAAVRAGSGS